MRLAQSCARARSGREALSHNGRGKCSLAQAGAWHYFPPMQRAKAQMLEKTGAILRLQAASARALGDLKRLVLRRP